MFTNILLISIGAIFGALLRWVIGMSFNSILPWMAIGTLLANWLGAFIIGIASSLLELNQHFSSEMRLMVITGFLGSLTTFSSFSLEVVSMLQDHRWWTATSTITLHLLGSIFFTFLGIALVSIFKT